MTSPTRDQALVALEALQAEGDPAADLAVIALCAADPAANLMASLERALQLLPMERVQDLFRSSKIAFVQVEPGLEFSLMDGAGRTLGGVVRTYTHNPLSANYHWSVSRNAGGSAYLKGEYSGDDAINKAISRLCHELQGLGWRVPVHDAYDFPKSAYVVVDGVVTQRRDTTVRD